MGGRPTRLPDRRVLAVVVGASTLLFCAELGAVAGVRAAVDHHAYVSDLRLDAALETFRPAQRSGLAEPVDPSSFRPDRNPRTTPTSCAPLTELTSTTPVDGRSWTGVNGEPPQPVTLLVVRFADGRAARTELDRKRMAMLRCSRMAVTFPPFDAPAVGYAVNGRSWLWVGAGGALRWSLVGDGRRFAFYVRRYGNSLFWTYGDDVSTPAVREEVADSLVTRLNDLSRR